MNHELQEALMFEHRKSAEYRQMADREVACTETQRWLVYSEWRRWAAEADRLLKEQGYSENV